MKKVILFSLIILLSFSLFAKVLPFDEDIGQISELNTKSSLFLKSMFSTKYDDDWLLTYVNDEVQKLVNFSYGSILLKALPLKTPIFSINKNSVKVKDLASGVIFSLFVDEANKITALTIL